MIGCRVLHIFSTGMEAKTPAEFVKENWLGSHGWTQKGGADPIANIAYWECDTTNECCLLNYWNKRRISFYCYADLDRFEGNADSVEVATRNRQRLYNYIVHNLDRSGKSINTS